VYGNGYEVDIDKTKYSERNKRTHIEDAINEIKLVLDNILLTY
jgi:hypothetical protein